MRGRKPIPKELKILRGVQNDRINHSAPIAPAGKPEAPSHLDKLAVDEWERLCTILGDMGLLSLADGPALTLYCECYSKWIRARAEIAKDGMIVKSTTSIIKKGQVVATKEFLRVHPAMQVEIQTGRMMRELLVEFGLTPSSRSRIKSNFEPPRDKMADFLDRQRKKKA